MAAKKDAKKKAKKKTAKKATKKKVTKKKASKKKTTKKKAARKSAKKKVTKKKAAKKVTKKKAAKKVTKKKEAKKVAKKKTTKKSKKKLSGKRAKKKAKQDKLLQKTVDAKNAGSTAKFVIDLPDKKCKREVAPGVVIEKTNIKKNNTHREDSAQAKKLTAKELRKIHDYLIEKRETLLKEIKHQVGDSLGRNSTLKADAVDRATDAYDGDVSYEMIKAGHLELIEIEAALKKIEEKTYGKCEGCGCNISSTRLKVKPFASFCSECRSVKESSDASESDGTIWGFLDSDADDIIEDNN